VLNGGVVSRLLQGWPLLSLGGKRGRCMRRSDELPLLSRFLPSRTAAQQNSLKRQRTKENLGQRIQKES